MARSENPISYSYCSVSTYRNTNTPYISESSSPIMASCLSYSAFATLLLFTMVSASDLVSVVASFDEIVPRAINTAINNSIVSSFLCD